MEKQIAHYPLSQVKTLVSSGLVRATKTALKGAIAIGFTFEDMKEVILNLESKDFYKSMTSNHDNSIWQDVYRYPAMDLDIYLKVQILKNVVVISFKEL